MSVPYASTRITVLRRASAENVDAEFRGDDDYAPISRGTRAHFSRPTGAWAATPGGTTSATSLVLLCDVVDLEPDDLVLDETDQQTYRIEWAERRPLIEHVVAGVERSQRVS